SFANETTLASPLSMRRASRRSCIPLALYLLRHLPRRMCPTPIRAYLYARTRLLLCSRDLNRQPPTAPIATNSLQQAYGKRSKRKSPNGFLRPPKSCGWRRRGARRCDEVTDMTDGERPWMNADAPCSWQVSPLADGR